MINNYLRCSTKKDMKKTYGKLPMNISIEDVKNTSEKATSEST